MMRVEERNGRLYVYEVRREGHRVVRRYVGKADELGALAELDSAEHHAQVAALLEERDLLRATQEQDAVDAAQLAQLDRLVADGIEALGLHRPKRGPLRRKRHERQD